MRPQRGASLWTWAGALAALVLLALFLRWALRSDAQVLSDSIDEARDALVARDDAAFLGFFAEDVTYQGKGNRESLERDLARWHQMGLSQVFVLDRTIEVAGDAADIRLVVAVGPELIQIARVDVDLEAAKDEGGDWRVRAFSWRRP